MCRFFSIPKSSGTITRKSPRLPQSRLQVIERVLEHLQEPSPSTWKPPSWPCLAGHGSLEAVQKGLHRTSLMSFHMKGVVFAAYDFSSTKNDPDATNPRDCLKCYSIDFFQLASSVFSGLQETIREV